MHTNVLRAVLVVAIGTLVVGVPVLGAAPSAQAHNYLVSSTPSAGTTIVELPEQFEIVTNEPLLTIGGSVAGFGMQVRDAAGAYYGDGCIAVEGAAMSMGATLGEAGAYTVVWQVVSEDGHPVSGNYSFTWAPADEASISAGSAAPAVCGASAPTVAPSPGASTGTTVPGAGSPEPTIDRNEQVNLSDVLWIGGAVLAVGIAVAVAIVIAGRRTKKS